MNNMTDPSWLLFLCGLPYHHDLVRAPEIETILRAASILLGPSRILIHARYLIIWVHYVPSLSKSKYFTKLQLVEHKLGDIPVLNPPSPGPYIHSNYGGNIPHPTIWPQLSHQRSRRCGRFAWPRYEFWSVPRSLGPPNVSPNAPGEGYKPINKNPRESVGVAFLQNTGG